MQKFGQKFGKRLVAGAIGALAATVVLSGAANAATTLRWSDGQPNRGVSSETLQWMADEVEKRTAGDLKFEFHWGAALFPSKSAVKGVGGRSADVATIIAAYTPKELVAYSIGDVPLANSDVWVGMRAMYELANTHPVLQKMFADLNLVYLSNLTTSAIEILCKDKFITSLDDFKGTKIRAVGPYGRVFEELGADVVRLSQAKVYSALDSGIVECNQNYMYSIEVFKQYEIAKKLTKLDWGQHLAFGIVMNREAHEELSAENRKVLHEVASDFVDQFSRRIQEANEKALERMTTGDSPIEVRTMDPGEMEKLKAKGMEAVHAWVDRANEAGLPGQDIFDAYMALVAKYEKIRDTQGYPWTR
ncbi:C4-dicarboxylate TRAP transporter substrate-binding protein [Oceanibacterium hippocampi]|uniref:Bacterial extracellular solute-binding protein, family 7 n=1 Tax=Oceanibacterium hippocampi TaxID=745714 RepID=A0A1Y5U2Q4_9PROT|nr:C4-dicarboxylate TRAP transporter substrate-binding protein [Oceanibacterium hippocampi]SLN75744.1 Bacterial extracellular solute-binding protein, family 7 [Oceanibacterium hippocampi]